MTRYRHILLAPLLLAAVALPAPAQAFSLTSLWYSLVKKPCHIGGVCGIDIRP